LREVPHCASCDANGRSRYQGDFSCWEEGVPQL